SMGAMTRGRIASGPSIAAPATNAAAVMPIEAKSPGWNGKCRLNTVDTTPVSTNQENGRKNQRRIGGKRRSAMPRTQMPQASAGDPIQDQAKANADRIRIGLMVCQRWP